MRLRRFGAATKAEALQRVREALGEDALVLSTHSEADGSVVITTAVEVEEEASAADAAGERADARHDGAPGVELALIRTELVQLGRELHRMGRVLAELEGRDGNLGDAGRELAERLVRSGLRRHLAEPVARRFESEVAGARSRAGALHESLLAHLPVAAAPVPRVVAFVGTTGSGKTTTIAKIAARDVADGHAPPALLVADDRRVGGMEQLAAFARLLGAPIEAVRDAAELRRALATHGGRERVLIDTAGLCGDLAACAETSALLRAARRPGGELHVTAVLSATTSASALRRSWAQLAQLAPRSCVVTRLDECDEPGTAFSFAAEAGLPIAWLGSGQRVPDDLVAASGEHLARWLSAA
ncbi:MAG: hypothetical protein AB1689_18765 [Thermodesulfobacteriota bacterium]